MPSKHFTTTKYIALFAVVYLGLMFIVSYIIQVLAIPLPKMTNILVIVASVLLINAVFAHKEKRPPSLHEYFWLVVGATLVDVGLEIYSLIYLVRNTDHPVQWGALALITLGHTLLFTVGFFPRGKDSSARSAA